MAQKIIFELSVQDANIAVQLDLLRGNLKEINKELRGVDQSSKAFESLSNEAAQTRVQISQLTEQQKALRKEFAAAQIPTDSLAGLRIQYSQLVTEITKLTKAERESKAGQDLIKNAAGVKAEINDIQESVGNFTGSVGNYKNSVLEAFDVLGQFGGSLGEQAGLLNLARQGFDAVSIGAQRFAGTFKEGLDRLKEGAAGFKDYLSNLDKTKKVQKEVADTAGEVGEAVGESAAEGVKAGAGLAESAKGASLFSRAGTALKGVLIGLGIGLIITLFTSLIAIFQRFAPIVDFVEQAVAGLSAAFDVLVSRAVKFFSGIGKFLTGDFSGGFDEIADSVSGIGEAMVNAAIAAADLQRQFQDLEDAQKDFVLQNAKAEAAVKRLEVALKDRTKGDADRLKIAAEIGKIETSNLAAKTDLINREIELEKKKLLLTGQVTQEQADQIAQGNFDLARQLEDEFKLKQDQTDKIRDLLVSRVNAEGESATLLERVENRKNAIIDQAAERRAAAAKKTQEAIDKETKALEAQQARIQELAKSIRDLDATTILNEFDQRATEIENRRADALEKVAQQRANLKKKIQDQGGIIRESDKKEADLIEEQTASIIAAYQKQVDEVTAEREATRSKAQAELRGLSLEVQKLADQNAQKLAEIEAEIINTDFDQQQTRLKTSLAERQKALNESLLEGNVTQKEYQQQAKQLQVDFNAETADLERKRVQAQTSLAEQLKKAKIQTARATLNVELDAIKQASEADISALNERAKSEGIDTTAQVTEREKQAAEQRKTAYQNYAAVVNEASASLTQTQLDGLKAVNDADANVQADKLRRLEEEKKKRAELQDFLLESAGTIASAIIEIEKNRLEQQTAKQIDSLDTEYAKKKEAAQGNQTELERLDKEYAKKKEAIEKASARQRKQIAFKEALIQGALSVIKALPNLFLAAAAAVATAAQIAVINSQTFAKGGIAKMGTFRGRSHSAGGIKGVFEDGTRIEVEGDEDFIILNKRASAERRRLSQLNHRFGGKMFETGGALDFTPQIAIPSGGGSNSERIVIVTEATFSEEQIVLFADKVAGKTATESKTAIAEGLNDANRRNERETALAENRAA